MILFYTSLLVMLGLVRFVTNRRVASLEKRYARTAAEADKVLFGETVQKQGNSSQKLDTCETAKRQFLLGQLVQKRDALEGRHNAWAQRAEKVSGWIAGVRAWKGRKLPYTMGVLDVSTVMYLIDRYGLQDQADFQNLLRMLTALISSQ